MKKSNAYFVLILALLFVAKNEISADDGQRQLKELNPIFEELNTSARRSRLLWTQCFMFDEKLHEEKSAEEVIQDIDVWISHGLEEEEREDARSVVEYNLVVKHRSSIEKLFDNFEHIGIQDGKFLYFEEFIPLIFAVKDNSLSLLVTGVVSNVTYNTIQTTARTRAADIIQSIVIPSLYHFDDAFYLNDIKHYGMTVAYGSKDFSKRKLFSDLSGECVSFVVSAKICNRFVNGEITEEELVESADIFLLDRDMVGSIKKVQISLQ